MEMEGYLRTKSKEREEEGDLNRPGKMHSRRSRELGPDQLASSFELELENVEPATRFGRLVGMYSSSLGACGVRASSRAILSLP
jgi:hypothetical protein